MATVTAYHNDITGGTYYAYPVSQSLGDWATYRVALSEASSPNTGRYSGSLNDATATEWFVFSGATQPSTWSDAVATIYLPLTSQYLADASLTTPTGQGQSLFNKAGATGATPVDATQVSPSRTFYAAREGHNSRNIITILDSQVWTVAVAPALNPHTDISTVALAVTGPESVTPTNARTSADRQLGFVDIPAITTDGDYTFTFTLTTTDSQTLVQTGLVVKQ